MAIAESSTDPSPGPFKAGIVAGRAYGSLSSDGKNEFAAKSVTRGSTFITCGPQKQLRFENQHDTGNGQRC
jgi:hypothetical protein